MSSETVNNSTDPVKPDEDKNKSNQQGSNNPPASLSNAMEVVENNHVGNAQSPSPSPSPSLVQTSTAESNTPNSTTPATATADKMEMATPIASPKLSSVSVESKMQIDAISSPPSSSATSSSSSLSSLPSSPLTILLSPFINKICSHAKLSDSSLRHIHKTLLSVKKTPAALNNRKFRLDNVAIKKFITDIDGAVELLQAIGYQLTEKQEGGKNVKYLTLEMDVVEKNAAVLEKAIELINQKIENPKASITPTSTTATALTPTSPTIKPSANSSASASASASTAAKSSSAAPASSSSSTPANSAAPIRCVAGCGFFGDPQQDNYCSQCYRKKLSMPTTSSAGAQLGKCTKLCGNYGSEKYKGMCSSCGMKQEKKVKEYKKMWKRALLKLKAYRRFLLGRKHAQVNKNRCFKCNKKIGINGFECRCQFIFCSGHRHPEDHECNYDVKSLHRKKLAKENYTVAGSKLEKIDR